MNNHSNLRTLEASKPTLDLSTRARIRSIQYTCLAGSSDLWSFANLDLRTRGQLFLFLSRLPAGPRVHVLTRSNIGNYILIMEPFSNSKKVSKGGVNIRGPFSTKFVKKFGASPTKAFRNEGASVAKLPFLGATFVSSKKARNNKKAFGENSKLKKGLMAPVEYQRKSNFNPENVPHESEPDSSAWKDIENDLESTQYPTDPGPVKRPRKNETNRSAVAAMWRLCHEQTIKSLLFGKPCCSGDPFSRNIKILLISFETAETKNFNICSCKFGATSLLINMGYFPSTPTQPAIAFSSSLLTLFHEILMEGPISKRGFSCALRIHLERITKSFLPDLTKPFYNTYAQWQAANDSARERFLSDLTASTVSDLNDSPKMNFSLADPINNCPACFYRTTAQDLDEPLICGVDAVFSHRRLKGGKGHDVEFESLPTYLFHNPGQLVEDSDVDRNYKEVDFNCGHSFRAISDKPKSYQNLDETGLMGVTCRHGCGIQYVDLYEGEKYKYAYTLFQYVKDLNPRFTKFFLMYDIACRYDSYFKKRNFEFWKQSSLIVNTFHVFGHPLECRITRGPRNTTGIGYTDGEQCERDWASKRHLVPGGKHSSSQRRRQILDAQSRRRNILIVMRLPKILSERYKLASSRMLTFASKLRYLHEKPIKIMRSQAQDSEAEIYLSNSFLDAQIASQKEFFTESTRKYQRRTMKENKCAYQAIKHERDNIRKLQQEYQKAQVLNTAGKTISNGLLQNIRNYEIAVADFILKTDKVLHSNQQTREDWKEDKGLWKRFDKGRTDPVFNVYKAYEALYQNQRTIIEKKNKVGVDRINPVWLALAQQSVDTCKKTINDLLNKNGFSAEDHQIGSEIWTKFKTEEIKDDLDQIILDLTAQVSERISLSRNIHGHASGQGEALPLIKAMFKSAPKIAELIRQFNAKAMQLPGPARISPLDASTFIPSGIGEDFDPREFKQLEALWNVELLRVRSDVQSANIVVELKDDYTIWSTNQVVREALVIRGHYLRTEEEIHLVESEASRLWEWSVQRSQLALDFISNKYSKGQNYSKAIWSELAWYQVGLLRIWVTASDPAIFPTERRQKALGERACGSK